MDDGTTGVAPGAICPECGMTPHSVRCTRGAGASPSSGTTPLGFLVALLGVGMVAVGAYLVNDVKGIGLVSLGLIASGTFLTLRWIKQLVSRTGSVEARE